MNTRGNGLLARLWPHTGAPGSRDELLPTAGLLVAAALALSRLGWNLARPEDLFLDSWVLVHVLRVLDGEASQLPRAALTLQYPLSYLPFYPVAKILGAFTTVKVVYPVLASLAAVPAYMIVRRGPAPLAGVIAMLLLPDLVIKTLTGTPQGIALPLFFLALYFAFSGRHKPFLITAGAVLLTHHLTGLITLVLYFTVWLLPRSREAGFLRKEWLYLSFFAAWPLYWAWTFSQTDQWYMAPILLLLVVLFGVPIAALLYLATPQVGRLLSWLGYRMAALPAWAVMSAAGLVALVGWSITGLVLESPGLSTAAANNQIVVGLYGALLVVGGFAAVARRHLGLTLFMGTLLTLGFIVLALGCHHVFDGLRVVDYAVLGGLTAMYAPGLQARWIGKPLLIAVALIAVAAGLLRLEPGYERLFAHTDGHLDAARWVGANTAEHASIASDTKMSLLVLGEGNRNATFEGTWWLFDGSPIASFVSTLNSTYRFRDRPISYVLLSDYMLERGAEVTWFSSTIKADRALPTRLDGIGDRVYQRDGVTIWALAPELSAAGTAASPRINLTEDLLSRLYGGVKGGPCR